MAETIRGKGVISGIAIGKIMLAGRNLDSYLVNYVPESLEAEEKKAQEAIGAVAEILRESIERLQKQDMGEQAAIMEAHRMMVQDPMMTEKNYRKDPGDEVCATWHLRGCRGTGEDVRADGGRILCRARRRPS